MLGLQIFSTINDTHCLLFILDWITSNQALFLLKCCGNLVYESNQVKQKFVMDIWESLNKLGIVSLS